MKMLRTSFGVALLVVCPGTPRAQVFETYDFITLAVSARLPIPDGDAAGVSDVRTITSVITQISSITVSLDISGEFNGDLYASLRHDSGFSVLLNRPGRTSLSPAGYGDSGLNVTLSDGAANGDIHLYRTVLAPEAGSPLTGEWQSDGRNVDPGLVLDTSPRTAGLDVFNGLNANGEWMLFVADLQSGGTSTLNSWSMEFTAVPEPGYYALAAGASLLGFAAWRRLRGSIKGLFRHHKSAAPKG